MVSSGSQTDGVDEGPEAGVPGPEKRLTKSLGATSRLEVDVGGAEFALRSTNQAL